MGADVETNNDDGATPASGVAAQEGHTEMVRLLAGVIALAALGWCGRGTRGHRRVRGRRGGRGAAAAARSGTGDRSGGLGRARHEERKGDNEDWPSLPT